MQDGPKMRDRELGDSLGNFEGYFSSQYFWPIANSVALGMRDDRA